VVDHRDPVGQLVGLVQVLGGQQHRGPAGDQPPVGLPDLVAAARVQPGGGRTGISDEQWWAAREPLFDKYFDPERYPNVVRVAAEGAFEQPAGDAAYTVAQAQQSFEFGLARVLDGIETFVDKAGSRPAADGS
jgi:hypothetical protein